MSVDLYTTSSGKACLFSLLSTYRVYVHPRDNKHCVQLPVVTIAVKDISKGGQFSLAVGLIYMYLDTFRIDPSGDSFKFELVS